MTEDISKNKLIIAISGKSGSGNTSIGQLVASTLKLNFINYTFRNLAQERNKSLADISKLARQGPEIDRYVDARQAEMARQGNSVLSSRLAIWTMKEASLKVYLHAPKEVRGTRIHKRENGDLAEKLRETELRDLADHQRYLDFYKIDNNDFFFADLIINTQTFDVNASANIIINTVKHMELKRS